MQRSDYTTQQGITGKFNTMDYNHNVFQGMLAGGTKLDLHV